MKAKNAIIITIGDELLIGQVIDTNSTWIAGQLEPVGVRTIRRWAIPDEEDAIRIALDEATKLADYIFLTGGLGPTKDDLTKQALANYFGSRLIRHETSYQHIVAIFERPGRILRSENEDQALVPDNCTVLQNNIGTAPGMLFEKEGRMIFSMPGVPYEMKAMFQEAVLPRVKAATQTYKRLHHHFLLVNASETEIARAIKDVENNLPSYIRLAYLPGLGLLRLRLTGSHEDAVLLKEEMDALATDIRLVLKEQIVAENNLPLENLLGNPLRERQLQLGFAESCTGGLLGNKITNIPGSSDYFKGSVVSYAYEVKARLLGVSEVVLKKNGAVSEATVKQMAEHARQLLNVDIALAVSGILGPGGGSAEKPVGTVWMAISDHSITEAKFFKFHYDRLQNKERAANAALAWLLSWVKQKT